MGHAMDERADDASVLPQPRAIRVSYLLSTYNRATFLPGAFSNLREIITPQDELIVVDGGSTDNTAEIIRANRDIVSSFISEADKGEAHGFNKGLLLAKGEFIKFVTDDDYVYPDGMRAAISILERNPDVDALYCGGERSLFDEGSRSSHVLEQVRLPPPSRLVADRAHAMHYACGLGLILRRRILPQVGLLDTTFRAVDADYVARLFQTGVDYRYADIKLFRHVHHSGSGQGNTLDMDRDRIRVALRLRRFDLINVYHSTTDRDFANAVGLTDVSGGLALARIVIYLEAVRRSPFRFCLFPAAMILKIGYEAARVCYRAAARIRHAFAKRESPASSNVVSWTGEIR